MRKILFLSIALALFLLVAVKVQHTVVLAMTSRPFLGAWGQDAMFFSGGPPSHIQFQRGGTLWISRFGEAPRQAHWEEGTRGPEIVITGFDPAQPQAQESYRWHASRGRLLLFPMSPRSGGIRVVPPGSTVLNYGYTRASSLLWSAPPSLVGRWASPPGRSVLGMRNGKLQRIARRMVMLELQPEGKLWLHEEGRPRRRGSWTADETTRTFALVDEEAGSPSSRATWTGRIVQGPGGETTIDFGFRARRPVGTGRPKPPALTDYIGSFKRVSEAPADQRPFLGVWRTPRPLAGRELQLELLSGGKLRVTVDDGTPRRGSWKEAGPWPHLTLTGLDPEQPERETEWYWSHRNADTSLVYGLNGRERYVVHPEMLELFDAEAGTPNPTDGTVLALERIHPAPPDGKKRLNSTHP